MSGTFARSIMPGITATVKAFSVRGASVIQLRDGLMTGKSFYLNMATFLNSRAAKKQKQPMIKASRQNYRAGENYRRPYSRKTGPTAANRHPKTAEGLGPGLPPAGGLWHAAS